MRPETDRPKLALLALNRTLSRPIEQLLRIGLALAHRRQLGLDLRQDHFLLLLALRLPFALEPLVLRHPRLQRARMFGLEPLAAPLPQQEHQ